jgi:hypothetical protein
MADEGRINLKKRILERILMLIAHSLKTGSFHLTTLRTLQTQIITIPYLPSYSFSSLRVTGSRFPIVTEGGGGGGGGRGHNPKKGHHSLEWNRIINF